MASNRLPARSEMARSGRSTSCTIAEGFVPDPNSPKFNAAVDECVEAFRDTVRKGGDEIGADALDAFGASLDSCTLDQVNALTAKFRARVHELPALKESGR